MDASLNDLLHIDSATRARIVLRKALKRQWENSTLHQRMTLMSRVPYGTTGNESKSDDDLYESLLRSSNYESVLNASHPATELIAQYEIKSIHILCLEGFIRKYFKTESFPIEIFHLLLIFYAKPLTFHCRWDSQTDAKSGDIIYCAVCDNWDTLLIKIANIDNKNFQKAPNIISYHSKNESQTQAVTNIYGQCGFNRAVNLFQDNQELICSTFDTKYSLSPNIDRMIRALSEDQCKWTSKALNTYADLLELFQIYLDAEQLDDEGIEDEFGDDACLDECFFIEWLRDENNERLGLSIKDEDQLTKIWKYLSSIARI